MVRLWIISAISVKGMLSHLIVSFSIAQLFVILGTIFFCTILCVVGDARINFWGKWACLTNLCLVDHSYLGDVANLVWSESEGISGDFEGIERVFPFFFLCQSVSILRELCQFPYFGVLWRNFSYFMSCICLFLYYCVL